jgi:hypothetical protein
MKHTSQIINVDWSFGLNKTDSAKISQIIKDLSDTYLDESIFLPHITFYGTTQITQSHLELLLSKIKTITGPFTIDLHRISYAEPEAKTLYIEVLPAKEMNSVYQVLENEFHQQFSFNPHISLIYKQDLPVAVRKKLSASISFPKQVRIDSIILVDATKQKNKANYFREWKYQIHQL